MRSAFFSLALAAAVVTLPSAAHADPPEEPSSVPPLFVASTLGFAIGSIGTGLAFTNANLEQRGCFTTSGCDAPMRGVGWLVGYAGITTVVPSIPRFAAGDVRGGLLFTGARGASLALATAVPWSKTGAGEYFGPVIFGVVLPLGLGVIDLTTSPMRDPQKPEKPGVQAVAPVPVADAHGAHGMALAVSGVF